LDTCAPPNLSYISTVKGINLYLFIYLFIFHSTHIHTTTISLCGNNGEQILIYVCHSSRQSDSTNVGRNISARGSEWKFNQSVALGE
jgi:hypothetical protein